jgi:hypothetical protein
MPEALSALLDASSPRPCLTNESSFFEDLGLLGRRISLWGRLGGAGHTYFFPRDARTSAEFARAAAPQTRRRSHKVSRRTDAGNRGGDIERQLATIAPMPSTAPVRESSSGMRPGARLQSNEQKTARDSNSWPTAYETVAGGFATEQCVHLRPIEVDRFGVRVSASGAPRLAGGAAQEGRVNNRRPGKRAL